MNRRSFFRALSHAALASATAIYFPRVLSPIKPVEPPTESLWVGMDHGPFTDIAYEDCAMSGVQFLRWWHEGRLETVE